MKAGGAFILLLFAGLAIASLSHGSKTPIHRIAVQKGARVKVVWRNTGLSAAEWEQFADGFGGSLVDGQITDVTPDRLTAEYVVQQPTQNLYPGFRIQMGPLSAVLESVQVLG